jgi:hypothetical protein
MPRSLIALLLIALTLPHQASAQEPTVEAAPVAGSRCDTPAHHQFDFWLGDWNVVSNGVPAGTNSIVSIQGGCVLQENWKGAGNGGITGTSFNVYDRDANRWHQTWVDASGTLLQLDGTWADGSMVLVGERPSPAGSGSVLHRIAWTPDEDGSVRQLWEASQDGGKTWNVIFDGLYTRADAPQ